MPIHFKSVFRGSERMLIRHSFLHFQFSVRKLRAFYRCLTAFVNNLQNAHSFSIINSTYRVLYKTTTIRLQTDARTEQAFVQYTYIVQCTYLKQESSSFSSVLFDCLVYAHLQQYQYLANASNLSSLKNINGQAKTNVKLSNRMLLYLKTPTLPL